MLAAMANLMKQRASANYNGTGIAIKNGYLYASSDDDVYRYKLDAKGNMH
jgi:hypothetical protein